MLFSGILYWRYLLGQINKLIARYGISSTGSSQNSASDSKASSSTMPASSISPSSIPAPHEHHTHQCYVISCQGSILTLWDDNSHGLEELPELRASRNVWPLGCSGQGRDEVPQNPSLRLHLFALVQDVPRINWPCDLSAKVCRVDGIDIGTSPTGP